MTRIAIYGAGGFGREVAPLVCARPEQASLPANLADAVVFVSDFESEQGRIVNGRKVISFQDLCSPQERDRSVVVAIADVVARRSIVTLCRGASLKFVNVCGPTHLRYDTNEFGEGAIICDNTMITSNTLIGRHFHLNYFSYVAHDCVVGDFVTFAPRASCSGWVNIEDDVYIGAGAVIRPGTPAKRLTIGKGAVIGMGAVVTSDVQPGTVMVGNPARPIEKSRLQR